jgi:hypothetical protein
MRIDGAFAPAMPQIPYSVPVYAPVRNNPVPAIVVDISPEGWEAYSRNKTSETQGAAALAATECQTCKSRRYQDVSNDSSVSFQSPTHIDPSQAASAVAAHEREHAANEQLKADQEGRDIVSQTVRLHTSICPECGRVYVSGGETRTVTAEKQENPQPAQIAAGEEA